MLDCSRYSSLTNMYLAVCTIQRNNAKKIREWIIYHSLVGVSKFYFLAHRSVDNTKEVVHQLMREGYDIEYFENSQDGDWYPIQYAFYNTIYQKYNHLHKWIGFIDDDEYIVPVQKNNLVEVLSNYEDKPMSSLGVHWACYGSSNNLFEPDGLTIENYKFRMHANHRLFSNNYDRPNMHVKSIVKCNLEFADCCIPGKSNMHLFHTPMGTYDELLRPFDLEVPYFFYDYKREPSYEHIRINHYVLQSFENYLMKKNKFKVEALKSYPETTKSFWYDYDINDVYDDIMDKYIPLVKEKI